jgi:hypothetical protein
MLGVSVVGTNQYLSVIRWLQWQRVKLHINLVVIGHLIQASQQLLVLLYVVLLICQRNGEHLSNIIEHCWRPSVQLTSPVCSSPEGIISIIGNKCCGNHRSGLMMLTNGIERMNEYLH